MADELLTLTPANARSAYESVGKSERKLMKKLYPDFNFERDITEIVTSYESACEVVGIKPLNLSNFSFFPLDDQDSIFASHQIDIIARALNGKTEDGNWWTPDYTDGTWKYYPYFYWNKESAGGSGFSYRACDIGHGRSYVGARHTFKKSDHAVYAGKTFIAIYNRFLKPLRS